MIDTKQELSREQCMEILGWASYAGFSDEQLQAAVHNQRVRQRWGSLTTDCLRERGTAMKERA
jgi:2-hydroxychromene-2-carboxylate isomerase